MERGTRPPTQAVMEPPTELPTPAKTVRPTRTLMQATTAARTAHERPCEKTQPRTEVMAHWTQLLKEVPRVAWMEQPTLPQTQRRTREQTGESRKVAPQTSLQPQEQRPVQALRSAAQAGSPDHESPALVALRALLQLQPLVLESQRRLKWAVAAQRRPAPAQCPASATVD